jgi:hypothetical protein
MLTRISAACDVSAAVGGRRRRRRRRHRIGRRAAPTAALTADDEGDGGATGEVARRPAAASAFTAATSTAVNPFGARQSATTTAMDPFSGGSGAKVPTKAPTKAMPAMRETPKYRDWDDVEVYEVPAGLRREGSTRNTSFVEYKSLEELFPNTKLSETFHGDAGFRTDIRRAMRDDLFIPDENLSPEKNAAMRSLSSSVHVNWFESATGYASLTKTFEKYGVVNLTGEHFIRALGGLCRTPCHGTLIDIASIGKQKIRHSWHQDSGYERFTVMLGFPAPTPSESLPPGVGVFTHAVKLSHALKQPNAQGSVIQWENYNHTECGTDVEFDVKYIARPVFGVGCEVMVYCDAHHVHSAPDEAHREAVWRFM